jgi:hypothetical protein
MFFFFFIFRYKTKSIRRCCRCFFFYVGRVFIFRHKAMFSMFFFFYVGRVFIFRLKAMLSMFFFFYVGRVFIFRHRPRRDRDDEVARAFTATLRRKSERSRSSGSCWILRKSFKTMFVRILWDIVSADNLLSIGQVPKNIGRCWHVVVCQIL